MEDKCWSVYDASKLNDRFIVTLEKKKNQFLKNVFAADKISIFWWIMRSMKIIKSTLTVGTPAWFSLSNNFMVSFSRCSGVVWQKRRCVPVGLRKLLFWNELKIGKSNLLIRFTFSWEGWFVRGGIIAEQTFHEVDRYRCQDDDHRVAIIHFI